MQQGGEVQPSHMPSIWNKLKASHSEVGALNPALSDMSTPMLKGRPARATCPRNYSRHVKVSD